MLEQILLLKGIFDLFILKVLSVELKYGYGFLVWLEEMFEQQIVLEDSVIYQVFWWMEGCCFVVVDWGFIENNCKVCYYFLMFWGVEYLNCEVGMWLCYICWVMMLFEVDGGFLGLEIV